MADQWAEQEVELDPERAVRTLKDIQSHLGEVQRTLRGLETNDKALQVLVPSVATIAEIVQLLIEGVDWDNDEDDEPDEG